MCVLDEGAPVAQKIIPSNGGKSATKVRKGATKVQKLFLKEAIKRQW